MKRLAKILGCCFICILSSGIGNAQSPRAAQTPQNRLTTDQWRADLRYMIDQLEIRHVDLYGNISQDSFRREADAIAAKMPELTDEQILFELARLTVLIGDGHTGIFLPFDRENGFRRYPIEVFAASDGWLIMAAAPEYRGLVGSRIKRIEKMDIESVKSRLVQIMPRDNSYKLDAFFALFLIVPEVLRAAGVATDVDALAITVEGPDKKQTTHILKPVERSAKIDLQYVKPLAELPLWLGRRAEKFWFKHLEDKKAIYVQFNSADIGVGGPEAQFIAFAEDLTRTIERTKPEKLVIDLRWNSGGNTTRTRHILYSIIKSDAINQRGRLFAITSPTTYSAGVWHTVQLEKHTQTLFVGTPAGGRPNHSGELRRFRLPHSNAEVRYSAVYDRDSEAGDRRPAIMPDLLAPVSSDDYVNGRDPALEAIFSYQPKQPVIDVLRKTISDANVATAVARYKQLKRDQYNHYDFGIRQLATLGYELQAAGKLADSIEIYKLNTLEFPYSAWVYDSLGRAYAEKGDLELAIQNLEKAFSIDKLYTQALELTYDLKKRLKENAPKEE